MKKLLIVIVLCLLLGNAASADTMREYTLSPAEINIDALLEMTFGDRAEDAQLDDRKYPFYRLPGTSGRPFCGLDDTMGFGQMRLACYPMVPDSENPFPGISENIEPSGIADCALMADEATRMSEAWLEVLGITDAYLQSVTAFGRLEGYTAGYMLAFGQQLNGLPVYWAAAVHRDGEIVPQSNRILFTVTDNGLVSMSGYWSAFTPFGREMQMLSSVEAGAVFAAMGLEHGYDELCYLLTGTVGAAVAIPAYRYGNRFINAIDGTALQVYVTNWNGWNDPC